MRVKITRAILLLIALLAVVALVFRPGHSQSDQQEQINHSTDTWQCVEDYGDQSQC